MDNYYAELSRELSKITSLKKFSQLQKKLLKKYKLKATPSYIQTLTNIKPELFKKLNFLKTKPTRTISGVAPIAIMTKPFPCPHGKCIYCPGGVKSCFGSTPQSYTGHEPASMRARRNLYDPYLQVFNRLEQYVLLNQNFDKVELIIMGGTFLSVPSKYQDDFVLYSFKAMNDFSKMFFSKGNFNFKKFKVFFELPSDVHDNARTARLQKKILKLKKSSTLKKEHLRNEISNVRCVAFALETRPDFCTKKQINSALKYGCTRMELGVQSLDNETLKKISRGHDLNASIKATQLLKDSFYKVTYHVMPGLPSSTKDSDIIMFKKLFSIDDFKPDALKIYPCMVMPGTKLHDLYKKNKFHPVTTDDAIEIISEAKRYIPNYCRILRIQRDIPTKVTIAGVNSTNFRQLLDKALKKKGIVCHCIRCRELKSAAINSKNIRVLSHFYTASKGQEVFISAEDTKNNLLLGFCRLRKPFKPFRKEITPGSVGIRELHVYGSAVGIGKKSDSIQHRGVGISLINKAETIAREQFNAKKILVISGIGARPYFKKLNYTKDGVYLSKNL